jgi:molybdopterin-guanine dinucleotide biosynthesis protein A
MRSRRRTGAVVLAGGRSSRLGRDKASLELLGRPLLRRVLDRLAGLADEYVVVRAAGQVLPAVKGQSLSIVDDLYRGAGPLGGIYTGLASLQAPRAIVVACDMPLLQPALLAELLRLGQGQAAVVPLNDAGLPEPLCAVYARPCLETLRAQLEAGRFKVSDALDLVRPRYVRPEAWRRFDPQGRSFQNVNTEEDLRRVTELLRSEEAGKRPV